MSESHFDEYEHYNFEYDKFLYATFCWTSQPRRGRTAESVEALMRRLEHDLPCAVKMPWRSKLFRRLHNTLSLGQGMPTPKSCPTHFLTPEPLGRPPFWSHGPVNRSSLLTGPGWRARPEDSG
uniref:Uncharacterized protein n=1 Tax=Amblyomma tuberculatum TaxID=48802 RepID=A0A6M2E6L7_9ACAR